MWHKCLTEVDMLEAVAGTMAVEATITTVEAEDITVDPDLAEEGRLSFGE